MRDCMENLSELSNKELLAIGYLRCKRCHKELLLEHMAKCKSSPYNGYDITCKECNRRHANKYYHNNAEVCLEKQREARAGWSDEQKERKSQLDKVYRENNVERLKQYHHTWYQNNKDVVIARVVVWAANNRHKTIHYKRKYAKENVEKVRAIQRLYRFNNPLVVRVHNRRRRSLTAARSGSASAADIAHKFKEQDGLCVYCGTSIDSGYHIDHIVPVSRDFSVAHNDKDNLQLLCPRCNLRKGSKTHLEFIDYCEQVCKIDPTYELLPTALLLEHGAYAY